MSSCEVQSTEEYARWKQEPHRLFEEAPEAILVFNNDLLYLDANPAACRLLRRSKQEILGSKVGDFSEQDGARLARRILESGPSLSVEENLSLRFADGSERHVELVTRPNLLPGIHASFSRDVTERRQMQRTLEQQNRLEAIGKVAGGVAHDFNNMLTAILSYVDLQLTTLPEGGTGRRYAEGIRAAAERAAETTQQLLAFCRGHDLRPAELDVNSIVREAARLVQRLIGEDIELALELEAFLPPVLADAGQLNQVLVNLAVNARDAMPEGGRLLLGTSQRKSSVEPEISIFVHDTGAGIRPEVLPHIFDPFFTTKPRGKGTGLGLATVYGIVKQSRGRVLVSSEPGRGTTFEVVLPAARTQAVVEPT